MLIARMTLPSLPGPRNVTMAAASTTTPIQPTDSQNATPSRRRSRGAVSPSGGAAPAAASAPTTSAERTGVLDARVQERVAHVDEEVDEHVPDRDEDHDALHHE